MVVITESAKKPSLRRKKLLALLCASLGVCSISVSVTLFFVDVPQIICNYMLHISPNSGVVDFMASEMKTVYNHVYLFNVTNGDRFLAGLDTKLKLQEVGPFTYKETRKNDDLELDTEAGVMRYSIRTIPTFLPERSIGRPEDFNVTMPNMPMLGVASMVSSYSFLPRMSFNLLSQQIRSKPLVTIDAHSYLWGYQEPILKLANKVVPGLINFDKLGIVERLYNENEKYLMVSSALDADKFKVRTRNGIDKLLMSQYQDPETCQYCDKFEDTYEGLLFPAPVTPERKIKLFRTGLCKLFDMEYNHTERTDMYEALVYRLSEKFFSLNKSEVNDGLLDLSNCYFGLPISLSKLYFMDIDPRMYERLEGLKEPDRKFSSFIMMDKKMGITLDTYVPLQVNLKLRDLSYHTRARPFSNMVLPICYVIIKQQELKEETLNSLNIMYHTSPILVCCVKLILIVIGLSLFICSIRIMQGLKCQTNSNPFPVLTTGEKTACVFVSQPLIRHEEYR